MLLQESSLTGCMPTATNCKQSSITNKQNVFKKTSWEAWKGTQKLPSDFAECCPPLLSFAAHNARVWRWKPPKLPRGLLVVGHLQLLLLFGDLALKKKGQNKSPNTQKHLWWVRSGDSCTRLFCCLFCSTCVTEKLNNYWKNTLTHQC